MAPKIDFRIVDRALARAVNALPAHRQTTENIDAIRDAICEAIAEGTSEEVELAQIGILAID